MVYNLGQFEYEIWLYSTSSLQKFTADRDDDGLPTKTAEGDEVAKATKKKLKKEFDNYKKTYDQYVKKAANEAGATDAEKLTSFIGTMEKEIAELTTECQALTDKIEELKK